jgi:hypothetical protein
VNSLNVHDEVRNEDMGRCPVFFYCKKNITESKIIIRRCGKISLSIWLYTYKNGERQTKVARVMINEYPPNCGRLNRGFYLKNIFNKNFCFKCTSIYHRNGEKIDYYRQTWYFAVKFCNKTKIYYIYLCILLHPKYLRNVGF